MRKFLSAMTMGLALTLAPATVKADYITYGPTYDKKGNEDGGYVATVWDDKGNWKSNHYYDKDGKYLGSAYASNPNPEGGDQGAIEPPDIKELAKQAKQDGKYIQVPPEFWTTKLGQELINAGKGPVPAINPNPEGGDSGGGLPAPKGPEGPGPGADPLNPGIKPQEQKLGGVSQTFEFQVDAGSGSEQIQGMAGKQGSTGGSSKPDKKTGAAHGAFGDLPGPPELVNPSWGSKDKGDKAKAKKVTAKKTGKTAKTSSSPNDNTAKMGGPIICNDGKCENVPGQNTMRNTFKPDIRITTTPGFAGGGAAGRVGR
jgi:hypothetical protein